MDFLLTLSFIFTLLFFLFMVKKIRNGFGKRNMVSRLPPGPWKLPIIGSIHHLLGSLPHRSLRNLSNRYGPFMEFQLAEVPALIVSSSKSAKEIMKINDLNFAQRPEFFALKIVTYGCIDVAFAPYGKYWRELRKLCVLELLTGKRVESFKPVREEEVLNLMKSLSNSSNSSPVNLTGEFCSLTNNITARAAFGNKCQHQARFLQAMKKALELSSGFEAADLFPSLSFIPVITGTKKKVEEIHRNLEGVLNDIIEEHIQQSVGKDGQEDLVDVLLRVQEQGNLEVPITTDNLKAIIFDIFSAGTETSSSSLGWIMAELMRNPTIMVKAQDEVRRVVRGNITVLESDISQLNYLKLVVKEVLRLHPPVPLVLRESRGMIEISGYKIPAKTKVIVNAWAIGRDPKQWGEDAETFKPERFLHISTDFKGANFEFIPYGAGRRMCPGVLFGLANIELPLAQLLYHFDWKLPNGVKLEDLDMTESSGLIVSLKSDLFLVPILSNPLPHD